MNKQDPKNNVLSLKDIVKENDVKLAQVITATEKLIQLVQKIELTIDKTTSAVNTRLDKMDNRMTALETGYNEMKNINAYKNYSVDAEDTLKEWMMQEKDKDPHDYPMSKNEISKAFADHAKRSRKS